MYTYIYMYVLYIYDMGLDSQVSVYFTKKVPRKLG